MTPWSDRPCEAAWDALSRLCLMLQLGRPRPRGVPSYQTVITLSSSLPTPSVPASSVPSAAVLDQVASELSQLQEDLLSADPRLAAGRLELASGWARSAASVQAVLSQAVAASKGEK